MSLEVTQKMITETSYIPCSLFENESSHLFEKKRSWNTSEISLEIIF